MEFFSLSSRYSLSLFLFFFLFFFFYCWCCVVIGVSATDVVEEPLFAFSFEGFQKDSVFDAEFVLVGDAEVDDSVVRMVPGLNSSSAGVLHRNPVDFGRKPCFSTDFSFSMSTDNGGYGIAFLIAPDNVDKESIKEHVFGLLPGVFAVEFDTAMDSESHDPNGNHVGVDVGSSVSIGTFNVSTINLVLNSGEKLHSWIDFDGTMKILEVRLNKSGGSRPAEPFISYPIDLSGMIWQDAMFVGIVSSSGNSTQVSTLYSWSFRLKHAAPYLMHSDPLDPRPLITPPKKPTFPVKTDHLPMILMALAFGAACGAAVAFLVLLVWPAAVDRRPVAPAEYPPHPVEFGYEKIVVVGDKVVDGGKM